MMQAGAVPGMPAPVFTAHIEDNGGFLRVSMEASPRVQRLYALAAPAERANPELIPTVSAQRDLLAQVAAQVMQAELRRNPKLTPVSGQMGLSFADEGGKLSFVFQMPVRVQ